MRSGFKAPKPTVAQRAKRHETIATRAAAQKAREAAEAARVMPKPAAERPRAPERKPVEAAARIDANAAAPVVEESTTPHLPRRNKSVREEPAKKVYPPRGIARSTGARAFPPARTDVAPATEVRTAQPVRPPKPTEAKGMPPVRERSPSAKPAGEPAETRRPLKEPPRLAKRISELFGCSRREADEWIENGWVRVDGVVVRTLGTRAHPKAIIEVKEDAKLHRPESVTIVLNKPEGVIAGPGRPTRSPSMRRRTVFCSDGSTPASQLSRLGRLSGIAARALARLSVAAEKRRSSAAPAMYTRPMMTVMASASGLPPI